MDNIVKFPSLIKDIKDTDNKIEVALKILQYINNEGLDFDIVINKKDAEKIFDMPRNSKGNKCVLTSNLEKSIKIKDAFYYPIEGNEF